MREELITDIVNAVAEYGVPTQDIRLKLTIILADYEIEARHTELAVCDEDKNTAVFRKFLASKVAMGCTEKTIRYYGTSLKFIFDRIDKNYDEVTADDIRLYLAVRIQQDQVSKTTTNNERRVLSTFYLWLQKEEILFKNPMAKVDVIKTRKTPKKAFEEIDLEKLRECCRSTREKLLVELMLSTWCRVSEVAQIRLDEIKDDTILVHGKGQKDRTVYLNAKSKFALDKYLAERADDNPYLFPKAKYAGDIRKVARGEKRKMECEWYKKPGLVSDNEHTNSGTIEMIIRKLGKRAGVNNTHPHRFRRTGATYALRQGMPLTTVSKLLGHAGIGVTQIYLDISDAELEEAHKKYVK